MNPRNAGKLEDANAIGEVGNPKCGDVMKIYLKINDNEIIETSSSRPSRAAAIATSSMITEMVKGKTISEALKINNKDVAEALGGLPWQNPLLAPCPGRIEAAVADYFIRKTGKAPGALVPAFNMLGLRRFMCSGAAPVHEEEEENL